MADLYDLEGFLAEQGINYSNPDLRPDKNSNLFPASLTGEALSEGAPAPGVVSSLSDFLSNIRRNSQTGGRPGNQSYEMRAMEAVDRANQLGESSPSAPAPGVVSSLSELTTQAIQGAPEPKSKPIAQPALIEQVQPAMKPPAPSGASEFIPTKNDLTLTRLQDQPKTAEELVKAAPTEARDKLSSIIESYENRLKEAQTEAEQRRATAGLFEAVNSFGAIATGREPSSDFFRRLAEDSDRPIEDLKQQLALEKDKAAVEEKEAKKAEEDLLNDPNSAKSVEARALVEGILPEFARKIPNFDQLSVNAIEKAFPMLDIRRQIDKDREAAAQRWAKIQADLAEGGKDKKGSKERMSKLEATDVKKTVENLNDIDTALKRSLEYARSSTLGGTGPIATLGGAKKFVSKDLQALENIYNKINIQNMVATFAGMSKAVDSDAERAAWNATQPNITNDDSVNVQILLGMQSSLLKDKIVKEAQREWLNQGRDLSEFKHPILEGTVTTVVSPNGEMIVVDKREVPNGFISLDDYAEKLYYGDQTPLPRPSGFIATQPQLTEQDKAAMKWLKENPDDPRAESVRNKLNKRMGQ